MQKKVNIKIIMATLLLIVFGMISINSFAKMANNEYHHNKRITLYLAGDSTVSYYSSSLAPRAGWGQFLHRHFDDTIVVKNAATPGRSSKSFIAEGRLKSILKQIKKGDYLFIQFGHNDEKMYDPNRYTEPYTTYKSYLKQYIDGARAKQAIPVLVTPVERRSFTNEGRARNSHSEYPTAMKELGLEEHVPVIDLTAKSKVLFQELGPDRTKDVFLWLEPGENKNYPNGVQDNTHFKEAGAQKIASLVLEGIKESNLVTLQDRLKK